MFERVIVVVIRDMCVFNEVLSLLEIRFGLDVEGQTIPGIG